MICEICGYKIDVNTEDLQFMGQASVYGITTLARFNDEGIIWDRVGGSMNERIKCPDCKKWITPDMPQVRKELIRVGGKQ